MISKQVKDWGGIVLFMMTALAYSGGSVFYKVGNLIDGIFYSGFQQIIGFIGILVHHQDERGRN